ncbi:Nadph-cytochrome p450 reductase, partial [Globisporangium splendens]
MLALVASAVLFMRPKKSKDEDRLRSEMLRIGEQMRQYQKHAAPAAAKKTHAESVDEDPAFPGGRVVIFFGSQTGTAEGFADVLKKEGRKHGFATHAVDLEEYDAETLLEKEKCVIFVMATYGEGDPTDNAVSFIKWLKNADGDISDNAFENVGFTVFGLGNRQYEHYNAIARLVDKKMEGYGAKRVYNYGEGDDDASLDEDFDEWKENLWKALRKQFIAGANAQNEEEQGNTEGGGAPELEYECEEIRAVYAEQLIAQNAGKEVRMKSSTKHFFTSTKTKVVVNRELRPSTVGGSTVHMEFDLRDTGVEYLTADNLAVLPENLSENVEKLAKRLGYDLDQWVSITPVSEDAKDELPFPSPCTIETILKCYLGINGAPRKGPLKQMAYYARDPAEKAKLLYLADKEGKDEYQKWILDDERSYVDVLAHFTSVQIPIAALIQLVPFMAPRYYTISSSSLVNPQRVHITVSIIMNEKDDGRVFHGVASTYLGDLSPLGAHDDKKKKRDSRPGEQGVKAPREWPAARIFIRPSTFRLPVDPKTPIILIGPGTGIAPMRAFLHERAQQQKNGVEIGESILYFGCRRRDEDYIYRDELEQFQSAGVLSQLHLAFSREQAGKVYVQHLLEQNGDAVYDLIQNRGAYIYVCGATSMGNDVHKVLHTIIERVGSQSDTQAAQTLKDLQDNHRYIQELWA